MLNIKTPGKRPPISFLFEHSTHFIACGGGSGLSPYAPGTVGTLFAWGTFPLLRNNFSDLELLVFLVAAFIVGVIACHRTGMDLGVTDHSSIVWDEIVPFWLVLLLCPADLLWQAAAFVLFRIFDIIKPYPANFFDTQVKNGLGVMMDDVVAAFYTVLALALLKFVIN